MRRRSGKRVWSSRPAADRPRRMLDARATKTQLATKSRGEIGTKPPEDSRRLTSDLEDAYEEIQQQNAALVRLERELAQARDFYVELYDFAPLGYAMLDGVGVVQHINLAGCRLLGRERAHLLGRPFITSVAANDHPAFLEHMRRCRQTRESMVETALDLRTADSRTIPVRLYTKQSLQDDGVMFRTIFADLTEPLRLEEDRHHAEQLRLRAEQDQQLLRASGEAKDRFIAMLSHELRTPLTPALFAVSRLMKFDGLPENSQPLLQMIRRNIELEARLIDDLLDVTRIVRGRLDVRLELVDAHVPLRETLQLCADQIATKRIDLVTDLSAGASSVRGDGGRLNQVYWNVLSNAIKFTDAGGRIIVRSSNPRPDVLRVEISDTGAGISADVLEGLFVPFEHVAGHGNRGGLGLGLTICKGIIDAHGGRISAASSGPGLGATFRIELPIARPRVAGETVVTEASPVSTAAAERRRRRPVGNHHVRILLVEDDVESAAMLSMLLTHEGYDVAIVHSVTAALARIGEGWDVVISDIALPDGSGLEVARRLKADRTPCRRMIALSGFGGARDLESSRQAGFDEHLVKPPDLDRLLTILGGVRRSA